MDTMSALFAALAGAIAGALIASVLQWRFSKSLQERLTDLQTAREREIAANMAYYQSALAAHSMLAAHPDLLELEGLTPEDFESLRRARVSRKEAAYLLMSLKADARWHEMMHCEDTSPYREGDYRYQMLRNKRARDAWKVLRKLIGNKAFADSMDKTVYLIEGLAQAKPSP